MIHRLSLVVCLALAFVACKKEGGGGGDTSKYPGTEDGAKQLLGDLRTSADAKGMTQALKPTSADYKAVFTDDVVGQIETGYQKLWSDPRAVITAKKENTELLLSKITTDDLAKWTQQAMMDFPGGYKKVGAKMKPGLTVYRWKYVKPGEKLGMSFDGLIYVNNHWAWFPKPWRALGDHGGGGGGDDSGGGSGGGGGGGSAGSGSATAPAAAAEAAGSGSAAPAGGW